ncbi:MAG: hypothetical protein GY944_09180 [bacterium]|nr:hypothetical protein [bacterium]
MTEVVIAQAVRSAVGAVGKKRGTLCGTHGLVTMCCRGGLGTGTPIKREG